MSGNSKTPTENQFKTEIARRVQYSKANIKTAADANKLLQELKADVGNIDPFNISESLPKYNNLVSKLFKDAIKTLTEKQSQLQTREIEQIFSEFSKQVPTVSKMLNLSPASKLFNELKGHKKEYYSAEVLDEKTMRAFVDKCKTSIVNKKDTLSADLGLYKRFVNLLVRLTNLLLPETRAMAFFKPEKMVANKFNDNLPGDKTSQVTFK